MIRPLLWPVSDDPFTLKPLAHFFDYGDAAGFVTANLGVQNLCIGEARYDHRVSGYRPAAKPSGYEDWLVEIGIAPDNGRVRVAA